MSEQAIAAMDEAGNNLLLFISDNVKSGQAKKDAMVAISRGLSIAANEIRKYGTKPYTGPEPDAEPVEPAPEPESGTAVAPEPDPEALSEELIDEVLVLELKERAPELPFGG